MHPAARQRRVRLCDGRRAGSLSAPVWGQRSSGLPDETSKQQVKETRRRVPARPGAAGLLRLRIRAQRGEQSVHAVRSVGRVAPGGSDGPAHESRLGPGDQATGGRGLPAQDRIVLVMDNLNTHHPASLYEAFEPAEARRIAERLEVPLQSQAWQLAGYGRDRNRGDGPAMPGPPYSRPSALRREVAAWQAQRNRDAIRVDWRFTTEDARIKLKSLYPSIQH